MTLNFSDHPGRRERHLQRRHGNPLFADPPPRIDPVELQAAQQEDRQEALTFQEEFVALIHEAVSLKPNEESEVILKLKERVDKAYEQASGLAGDQTRVKEAIPQLINAIMTAVRRGAGNDALALQELDQEEQARAMHYRLLEQPLVADLLAPDSPVTAEELLPTLLCAEPEALGAALQLFDEQQLRSLAEEGRDLLARQEQAGLLSPGARKRLALIENVGCGEA